MPHAGRQALQGPQLAERTGTTIRTVERDLARLIQAGVPVDKEHAQIAVTKLLAAIASPSAQDQQYLALLDDADDPRGAANTRP